MPRLTDGNQVTLPVEILRDAGIRPGDELIVRAAGPGLVELERVADLVGRYAGALRYPPGYLDSLRGEWESRAPAATEAV